MAVYKFRKQTIANPAVSTHLVQASPVGYRAMIINLKFRLDTDANVADRWCSINNYSGGDFTILSGSAALQTASLIQNYICHPGISGFSLLGSPYHFLGVPAYPTFETGDILQITINGKQAGDQLRDIRVHWALWPCPAG